jgi:hypothetical protein
MDKLRGTGSTFSTSGKRWMPFKFNPKVAKRNARLHRLLKAEIIKPMSKAEMQQIAETVRCKGQHIP